MEASFLNTSVHYKKLTACMQSREGWDRNIDLVSYCDMKYLWYRINFQNTQISMNSLDTKIELI